MSRTLFTFSVLQATAAVASLAIIMWSLGFPVLNFAQAANVTTFSNTLSDSAPSAASDHTIYFETPTGIATGTSVTIDFSDGPFGVAGVDFSDIDVQEGETDLTVAADCTGAAGLPVVGASFTGTLLTIDFCGTGTADIAASGSTTIEIGQNADGGVANTQITNPAKVDAVGVGDSYELVLTAGAVDTGETRVVIIDRVTVSATVDTILTFVVDGTALGTTVGSNPATQGATTPNTIPFGVLEAGQASTAVQSLEVSTNASNGFVVTVIADQQLTSSNGADIDSYQDGSDDATPVPGGWQGPGGAVALENEHGHWGLASDDATLTPGLTDLYSGGDNFVAVSTVTPVEVMRHDGPADGQTAGQGTANVVYQVEITSLQEAANDYTATLTYVATPVF